MFSSRVAAKLYRKVFESGDGLAAFLDALWSRRDKTFKTKTEAQSDRKPATT